MYNGCMQKPIYPLSVGRRSLSVLAGASVALILFSCSGESEQALTAAKVSTGAAVHYSDVAPIILSRCGICHIGGGTDPALGSYGALSQSADQALRAIQDGSMPPGGPQLPTDEITTLQNWINQGKPQ